MMKKIFLAGFMVVSTGLVLLIWADSLFEKDNGNPYYYRETIAVNGTLFGTLTPIIDDIEPGTPVPAKGQGQNKHDHRTPSATASWIIPPNLSPTATTDWDVLEMDQ